METRRAFTADRGDGGRRLDVILRRHLGDVPGATRTRIQKWIAQGGVAVNGCAIRRPSARVAAGDTVSVVCGGIPRLPPPMAEALPLAVAYEDEHLLAIAKPAGMVAHPGRRHREGTALNALLARARDWRPGERPSIVGRLDRLTSGLMVVAKTARAHAALQRALAREDAAKDYLALVYGRVKPVRGVIDLPLGRDPSDARRMTAHASGGAASLTRYERLARTPAPGPGLSLVRCRLDTGRMHQIRVHLAARGWPIVGDPVYGEARWSAVDDAALASALQAFPRQALHAWRTSFVHPFTGVRIAIEATVPADLRMLLRAAGLDERNAAGPERGQSGYTRPR